MIIGIGCDIIDIRRIEKLIKKYQNKFLERVFTKDEVKLAGNPKNSLYFYSYFAKRFATKEAYAKATGHGVGGEIGFKTIEIFNDAKRCPFFNQHPLIHKGVKAFVSISDEYPYAISYVILET